MNLPGHATYCLQKGKGRLLVLFLYKIFIVIVFYAVKNVRKYIFVTLIYIKSKCLRNVYKTFKHNRVNRIAYILTQDFLF